MAEVFTSKLSATRAGERSRIWLEGKRLSAAGFHVGQPFIRTWGAGRLVLTACTSATFEEVPRGERGTVSGKGDKPIIDITGLKVADTFAGSHVRVSYGARTIVIRD